MVGKASGAPADVPGDVCFGAGQYPCSAIWTEPVTIADDGIYDATSGPLCAGWEDDPYYYTAEDAGLFYIYRTPHAGTGIPDPDATSGVAETTHRMAGDTINDLIRDDEDWPNHGAFLGHVRDVTDSLVADGVIARHEQNAITRGAAQSGAGGRGGSI
jgi:hypothetical protein